MTPRRSQQSPPAPLRKLRSHLDKKKAGHTAKLKLFEPIEAPEVWGPAPREDLSRGCGMPPRVVRRVS